MTSTPTFYMIAGEASGDGHGSALIRALKKQAPHSQFRGVGGPLMRAEGLQCQIPMEEFQVMGITEIIRQFPRLRRQFYAVGKAILEMAPSAVILIDYPGFNLRMAKYLRKRGFQGKIIQYISPTIWAWGKGRLEVMKKTMDLVLTIYPFEPPYFAHTHLEAHYVGNPTLEAIRHHVYQSDWKAKCGLLSNKPIIGLFPGSRPQEIKRHFPTILQAAEKLYSENPDYQFAVLYNHREHLALLEAHLTSSSLKKGSALFFVPFEFRCELMKECSCAIAKSGTVNLELALHHVPTVVGYSLSKGNYLFAKYILRLRLPHYSIVNILAQEEVFPEHLVHNFQSENLFQSARLFLNDESKKQQCIEKCKEIERQLGTEAPNETAAHLILERVL